MAETFSGTLTEDSHKVPLKHLELVLVYLPISKVVRPKFFVYLGGGQG